MSIRTMLRSRRQRHADLILALLAAKPEGRYGTEMWRLSGLTSGAMYVALARLEREGLAVSEWRDQPGPQMRRKIYRATADGRIAAGVGARP